MRPEDIPRRRERLILADATQKFERLLITRIFATHDIAAFAELAYIARALWSGDVAGSGSHGSTNRTQNRDATHDRAAQVAVHVEARLCDAAGRQRVRHQ